uniref:Adhesion G protein-coupled receptor F3b n=1 Tax=Cyprinodon variegatus TaxID=28743 RepID=A0A3Q2DUM7_CYPVA
MCFVFVFSCSCTFCTYFASLFLFFLCRTFGMDSELLQSTVSFYAIVKHNKYNSTCDHTLSFVVFLRTTFQDVVEAASNMVNASWDSLPEENILEMSSQYLTNVEGLVKEIKINNSEGLNSSNLELRFCSSDDCSISIFGVGVNMNKTNGTVKTMAVKNLMNKLKSREFPKKNHSSLVLSATLVDSNDSDINIQIFFPDEQPSATERICVFWDNDAKDWSSEGCVANITDDNQTLCICNHLTAFSVLMAKSANVSSESLEMITYIGLGVSIFSLLIFLFVESLVWSAVTKSNLSHFRHTAVVNIAVFRLLADCSFLASIEPDSLSEDMCLGLTVCKHLFYLAMFCWMLCLSVMLVHQLIFVFSPVRKRVFMYLSSIVGYVLPMALVASSYVYYRYTEQEYFDKKSCWLRYDRLLEGSIHAFLLPVGTIVLSNLFSMVVVIVTLVKTSVPDSSKADDKDTAKSILKVVVFLTPVFGVTWIFGFVFLILDYDNPLHTPVNYIFTILNSFQLVRSSSAWLCVSWMGPPLTTAFCMSASVSLNPSRPQQMAAHTDPVSTGGLFLLKGSFSSPLLLQACLV